MRSTAITEPPGPQLVASPTRLRLWSERHRAAGLRVGLVPTMGALHEGHLSLVRRAQAECDRVVVSIFVNPEQFGPGEDLGRYPRRLQADLAILAGEGVAVAFIPPVEALYPAGHATRVKVGGWLGTTLEAEARPGHLEGVALVVTKLLAATRPDRAYFGEKDAQQCALVRRLVLDLDLGVEVVTCATVRDPDGLALSSRNAYLGPADRVLALALPQALAAVSAAFGGGQTGAGQLIAVARATLAGAPGLSVAYVALVDAESFEPVTRAKAGSCCVAAASVGSTRLIDAIRLGGPAPTASDPRPLCETVTMSGTSVHGGGTTPCSASS